MVSTALKPIPDHPSRGLVCDACGGRLRVLYTRPSVRGLRRRRECVVCRARCTTWERKAP